MLFVANGHVACSRSGDSGVPSVRITFSTVNFGSVTGVVVTILANPSCASKKTCIHHN